MDSGQGGGDHGGIGQGLGAGGEGQHIEGAHPTEGGSHLSDARGADDSSSLEGHMSLGGPGFRGLAETEVELDAEVILHIALVLPGTVFVGAIVAHARDLAGRVEAAEVEI